MNDSQPYCLTHFTPADAETITGVSTTMQRDWRRRKFINSTDGHARFNLFDLAEMKAMHMLASRGVGPAQSHSVALFLGLGIAWHVLVEKETYTGDHNLTCTWSYSDRNSKSPDQIPWQKKGEWIAKYLLRKRFGSVLPAPIFIWWADNKHLFHYSFDMALSDPKNQISALAGPAVVIDLVSVADMILTVSRKPFVHVEYEIDPLSGKALAPG